jgi:hypothetical protein
MRNIVGRWVIPSLPASNARRDSNTAGAGFTPCPCRQHKKKEKIRKDVIDLCDAKNVNIIIQGFANIPTRRRHSLWLGIMTLAGWKEPNYSAKIANIGLKPKEQKELMISVAVPTVVGISRHF